MGRNGFEAGHFCPILQKESRFYVLIGNPMRCPICETVIEISVKIERESLPKAEINLLKPGGERLR